MYISLLHISSSFVVIGICYTVHDFKVRRFVTDIYMFLHLFIPNGKQHRYMYRQNHSVEKRILDTEQSMNAKVFIEVGWFESCCCNPGLVMAFPKWLSGTEP